MSKVKKFWGCYLLVALAIVLAALAYTKHIADKADRVETVEYLMWEVNSARTEVEEGAERFEILTGEVKDAKERARQDGVIIRSVLIAAMASASNNIADAEAGSLLDCIDATCRVTTISPGSSHSMGTGVVFEIQGGKISIITNAHVATTPTMHLEFWKNGYKSDKITGTVTVRDRLRDVAVITVDVSAFDGWLPGVVPLATRDTVLKAGQKIMTVGCPRGEWAKAWVGHVVETRGTVIKFKPKPIGGQSGSAIFNAGGTCIVALLNQNERGLGRAVNIREIYDAIYGKPEVKETGWRRAPKKQCPSGDCPDQGDEGWGPGLPFTLPVPEAIIDVVPEIVIEAAPEIVIEVEVEIVPEDYELEAVWVDGDGNKVTVAVDLTDAPELEIPAAPVVAVAAVVPDEDTAVVEAESGSPWGWIQVIGIFCFLAWIIWLIARFSMPQGH